MARIISPLDQNSCARGAYTQLWEGFWLRSPYQVASFIAECKALEQQFQEGPGGGDTLQEGLVAITALREELTEFKRRAADLNNAENLFSLPVTAFSTLDRLDRDVSEQEKVYALYSDHDAALQEWASQLWVKVDFQVGRAGASWRAMPSRSQAAAGCRCSRIQSASYCNT